MSEDSKKQLAAWHQKFIFCALPRRRALAAPLRFVFSAPVATHKRGEKAKNGGNEKTERSFEPGKSPTGWPCRCEWT